MTNRATGNCTYISSNCSNKSVIVHTSNYFTCTIGLYIQVGVVCTSILPINIWALWLFCKIKTTKRHFASTDLLPFNLIITSIIFCINFIIYVLFIFNKSNFVLGSIVTYILSITVMAQVQFYTWICVDHYLAVVHPIFYLKLKKFHYRPVWVSVTWVACTVDVGISMLLQHNTSILLYVIPFCGSIALIIYCGLATLVTLKKSNQSEGERKKMHHQKIKAFKIISLTLMVLLITYIPYICLGFIVLKLSKEIFCVINSLVGALLLPGTVLQSLLYILHFFKA